VTLLRDILVVLLVAVGVVASLRRAGVPSILGFIVAGALVGPNALGLISEVREVEALAEAGVALLLFGIGLELPLARLRRLWRPILVGGSLQVGATIAATFGIARAFGLGAGGAALLGFVVAVSSTAIVLGALNARGEIEAPHGRLTLGILVFQDLCVVPMMLVLPLLPGGPEGGEAPLGWTLLKAVGVVAGVVVAARLVVPRVLDFVARTGERGPFVLAVVLTCLGTAWLVSRAGISLALGAFLAGLVVAGSRYRHQALSDLIPLREVLTSVFFVSVGMLLDAAAIASDAGAVFGLAAAILLGKFAIVFLVTAAMRLPLRVSVLSGAALAQIGEFAFVLTHAARAGSLLGEPLERSLTAAALLTMLVTPAVLALGPRLAAGVGRIPALTRLLDVRSVDDAADAPSLLRDHVIIAGYGVTGRALARALAECRLPYLVLDIGAENARRAAAEGHPAFFGDVTSREVLERLELRRARDLVLVINDPDAARRAIRAAREIAPDVPVLVRARFVLDESELWKAGATDVVTAEREAAVEVAARVLRRRGAVPPLVEQQLRRVRGSSAEDEA
jgi:CPA2 family monovalent cation:H+ antiporter-2